MKVSTQQPPIDNMTRIRIIPVCNGKIYVTSRIGEDGETTCMDTPMEVMTGNAPAKSGKTAYKLMEKYRRHLNTDEEPRFSVQYRMHTDREQTVYLYILPLESEDDICFSSGRFVTADNIRSHAETFSRYLNEECELLEMAAELWADYYATVMECPEADRV